MPDLLGCLSRGSNHGYLIHQPRGILRLQFPQMLVIFSQIVSVTFALNAASFSHFFHDRTVACHGKSSHASNLLSILNLFAHLSHPRGLVRFSSYKIRIRGEFIFARFIFRQKFLLGATLHFHTIKRLDFRRHRPSPLGYEWQFGHSHSSCSPR
jgi:hypothetical protein